MTKIPCTVAILAFNSAETIEKTLESVRGFAETIVCDGGSTDQTISIAKHYGSKILEQAESFKDSSRHIIDFSGVRNQTITAAMYKWYFYLDSDEIMTEKLAVEISKIVSRDEPAAYWVNRKYSVGGKTIDCAATYPTRQMRFFHLDSVTKFIKTVHERIEIKLGAKVSELENFMLVPVSSDPKFWREKWARYIDLEAKRRGKISFWQWFRVCLENLKISTVYTLRFLRNLLFCRGSRMPFVLEWERHVYNWNLSRKLWENIWQ